MKIPIIISIDVEPNGIFIRPDRPDPWTGFESAHEFFSGYRERITAATEAPARFVWLFRADPQIEMAYGSPEWAFHHYARIIEDLEKSQDSLGVHPHAYRWEQTIKKWLIDHGNQEWVNHCVQMSFTAFENSLGKKPDSFRFGDRWLNNETLTLAESLGARFDLTVEPGHPSVPTLRGRAPFTGVIPSYTGAPKHPYRPSLADFRVADPNRKDGLWAIPISTTTMSHELSVLRKLVYRFFDAEKLRPVHLTLFLNLDPGFFGRSINYLLKSLESPHLSLKVRTDSFIKPDQRRNVEENLQCLMSHPRRKDFLFSTPAEAIALLS